jgi:hypothetical protein
VALVILAIRDAGSAIPVGEAVKPVLNLEILVFLTDR